MWTAVITVLDFAARTVRIEATRTGDGYVRVYVIDSAVVTTPTQKADIPDQIWSMYQAELVRNARIEAMVSDLESALVAALEAREPL